MYLYVVYKQNPPPITIWTPLFYILRKSWGSNLFSLCQTETWCTTCLSKGTRRWFNFMLSIIFWEWVALFSVLVDILSLKQNYSYTICQSRHKGFYWGIWNALYIIHRWMKEPKQTDRVGLSIPHTFILTIRASMAASSSLTCLLISCFPSFSPVTTSLKRSILFFRLRTLTNPTILKHRHTKCLVESSRSCCRLALPNLKWKYTQIQVLINGMPL